MISSMYIIINKTWDALISCDETATIAVKSGVATFFSDYDGWLYTYMSAVLNE